MLRSDLNPFRALVAAAAALVLAAGVARATETATTTAAAKPATTTGNTKSTTTTATKATTPTTTAAKPATNVADAKRAAAKKLQHAPVMTTANAAKIAATYPWTQPAKAAPATTTVSTTASATFKDVKGKGASTAAARSPSYSMTVTAQRPATPKTTTAAKPSTTSKPTAATFSERMAKTTVTPPVMSSGAKAANTAPQKATTTAKAAVPAPKVAAVTPKSPPRGAKPGWFFRQVVASSSSSAKSVGTVALATKPTASWSNQNPAVAEKPAAKPATPTATTVKTTQTAAKTAPAFQNVKAGSSAQKPTAVAASLNNPKAANPKAPLTTSVQSLGAAFMEQREQYVYNSLNRRDPFASLVSGTFEGEVGTPLLDVSSMKLVGIVWGASDKFALVEDGHGHGFVLRVGDPVLNGYIAGLTKQELIVKQSSYGDTQTVTIQLQRKEGASNE